jgi:3-hydroxyacyl-[acyl-carrier-protein] dehydratase
MLFESKLYTIKSMDGVGENLHAVIEIISDHSVFKGHFPGSPVLPGVCTLQIGCELLSKYLGRKYSLIKSENIKFVGLVIPLEKTILNYEISFIRIDDQKIAVKCSVTCNEMEVLKMKGSYICLPS